MRYTRCREFDRVTNLKAALSLNHPTIEEAAMPMNPVVKRRLGLSHNRGSKGKSRGGTRALATTGEETQNHLHAEHTSIFQKITQELSMLYTAAHNAPGSNTRMLTEFKEARNMAEQAWKAVTDLRKESLASEGSQKLELGGKEHALHSQINHLQTRLRLYPKRGKCDAAFSIAIPDFVATVANTIGDQDAAEGFMKRFACFRASGTDPTKMKEVLFDAESSGMSKEDWQSFSELFETPNFDHLSDLNLENSLLLPYYLADYKLNGGEEALLKASNQRRMNTTSVVNFLRIIGITDFPVYGLAHSGPMHTVSVTWYSSDDDVSCQTCT